MHLPLRDKVILVTSGHQAYGDVIIEELNHQGALAIVLDNGAPGTYLVKTDLRSRNACERSIHRILDHFGWIDGLVNNIASIAPVGHFHPITLAAVPHLQNTRGSIVNLVPANPDKAHACYPLFTNKNKIDLDLTQHWANELIETGVRVNALFLDDVTLGIKKRGRFASFFPSRHPSYTPAQIARSVAFLLADTSKEITGNLLGPEQVDSSLN